MGFYEKPDPVLGLSMGLDKPITKCGNCERGEADFPATTLLVQDRWIRQHEAVVELLQKYNAAQRRLVNMGQKRLANAVQGSIESLSNGKYKRNPRVAS